jgi:3-dehydroquinate dehydratase type I
MHLQADVFDRRLISMEPKAEVSLDLDKIRDEIDSADSEMLRLLERRMELALQAGRIKASRGMPLFQPEREQRVYDRLSNLNRGGRLPGESLRSIYREIFSASRLVQAGFRSDFRGSERGHELVICGCLDECLPQEFLNWLNHPEADLVEWRMDMFHSRRPAEEMKFLIGSLSAKPRLPVIATNRPVRQLGDFDGTEERRLGMLEEAAQSGAEWVDFEYDSDLDYIERFRRAGAKVLISWHCTDGTPSRSELRARLESMRRTGADAVKIVTLAQSPEDNLRVLELIPLAGMEPGPGLIAFCMGPHGKWSRLASLLLGSPWAYARFEGRSPTAPGQLSIYEIGALLSVF